MSISIWKLMGGALAASLAIVAQAQVPKQPQPQGQPAGQPIQLTAEQRTAIGEVQAHNQLAIRAADAAANRGSTDEVKNLGRWLGNDARRVQTELARMLQPRGVQGTAAPAPATPRRQKIEQELAQLESRSGEQFDREFMTFLTNAQPAYVDSLKHARDVTPGKDPVFKKFLDDVENLEEGHLTGIRQAKVQRQARTPPAR